MTLTQQAQHLMTSLYSIDRDQDKVVLIENVLRCAYDKGLVDLRQKLELLSVDNENKTVQ